MFVHITEGFLRVELVESELNCDHWLSLHGFLQCTDVLQMKSWCFVIQSLQRKAFILKCATGCTCLSAGACPCGAARTGFTSFTRLFQYWTQLYRATHTFLAAVGLRSHGHGLHRLPGPVPGRLGSLYLHKLSRTSETSDGERGGEPAAQWADRRHTQAAGGASEGGSLTEVGYLWGVMLDRF